jgi:hypothetical protein
MGYLIALKMGRNQLTEFFRILFFRSTPIHHDGPIIRRSQW